MPGGRGHCAVQTMKPHNRRQPDSIQQPTGSAPRAAAEPGTTPAGPVGESDQPVHAGTGESAMEHRFRAIVDMAPDAMVVVDRDGHITLVNRQTEVLFGYAREQ